MYSINRTIKGISELYNSCLSPITINSDRALVIATLKRLAVALIKFLALSGALFDNTGEKRIISFSSP